MRRTWALPLAALLLLTAHPAAAVEPTPEERQLEAIRKAVKDSVKEELESIRAENKAQIKTLVDARLKELNDKIEGLQTQLNDLAKRLNGASTASTSQKPNEGATGRVTLANDYTTAMSVVVNGANYTLQPGQRIELSVPAGAYSYQVIGVHPVPQTGQVSAEAPKTIRVFPQGR